MSDCKGIKKDNCKTLKNDCKSKQTQEKSLKKTKRVGVVRNVSPASLSVF